MIDPYTDPYTVVPDATRAVADDTPAYAAWLQYNFAGNTIATWILSLVAVIGIYVVLAIGKRLVVRHLAGSTDRFSTQTGHLLDKIIADLRPWCMVAIALYVGSRVLILPSSAAAAFRLIFIVAVSLQLLLTSRVLVDFAIDRAMARTRKAGQEDPSIASASGIIRFLAMLVLGVLLVLLGLANFGVEITPLVTGLGIGGIAVALAAQSILGVLFGSLTLLLV
jgi:small-conductance mechanosensitive channel